MSIDLHVHSNASDGVLSPEALVEEAVHLGFRAVAIADHDTVAGIAPAQAAAADRLMIVTAIEFSATTVDGRGMHILGYRLDPTVPALLERLAAFREARRTRALAMIAALSEAGHAITVEDVMAEAGEGAVGRAHIARALTNVGVTEDMGQAFRELIGRNAPFYVAKPEPTPAEVIDLIRDSYGIPVLAHPGVSKVDDLIAGLVESGLQGLEVWHPEHSRDEVHRYRDIAAGRGLLATGGSDYHGPSSSGGGKRLGDGGVPDEALDALLAVPRG